MLTVGSVITGDRVAHARVLADSLREHHDEVRFTVLVVDEIAGDVDASAEPFDIITPAQTELPYLDCLASYYMPAELCAALKPWLLRALLTSSDHAILLDCDMRVYAPLDDLIGQIGDEGVLLTPHNFGPLPADGKLPDEPQMLRAGTFNTGFVAARPGKRSDDLLDWWSQRLRADSLLDAERAMHGDQRWFDRAPTLFEGIEMLTDPGVNVGHWNLHERPLSTTNGALYAGGAPLRLFHFSSFDPGNPRELSSRQTRHDASEDKILGSLLSDYAEALRKSGIGETADHAYGYDLTASGRVIDPVSRRVFRAGFLDGTLTQGLFTPAGEKAFEDYARDPAGDGADVRITRYLKGVREMRHDLRMAFPELHGPHGSRFMEWARDHGARELNTNAYLAGLEHLDPGNPQPVSHEPVLSGVNLVGFLRNDLGLGEAARQVVGALDVAGIPVLPRNASSDTLVNDHSFSGGSNANDPFPISLVCLNGDQVVAHAKQAKGPAPDYENRYTIGWWWWEVVDSVPDWFSEGFEFVDELWAGSRHVADCLEVLSPVPVVRIPLAVEPLKPGAFSRADLGLPEGFMFLFIFDYNSSVARKNPIDLIHAFTSEFEPGEANLVLKSIHHETHPVQHEHVRRAAAGHPDIVLIEEHLPAEQKDALVDACDCYVSLHRAEGFGLTMAEAMSLSKPVIATGYSGNLDFMNEGNSLLVDYTLIPVAPGSDPYPPKGHWAQPDVEQAARYMRDVYEDPKAFEARAAAGAELIRRNHSPRASGEAMARRMTNISGRMKSNDPTAWVADVRARSVIAANAGPPRSPRRRFDPRRLGRAAFLRVTNPLMRHHNEANAEIAANVDEVTMALRSEFASQSGINEARQLTLLRQQEQQIADLEKRLLRRQSELDEQLSALRAISDQIEARLADEPELRLSKKRGLGEDDDSELEFGPT